MLSHLSFQYSLERPSRPKIKSVKPKRIKAFRIDAKHLQPRPTFDKSESAKNQKNGLIAFGKIGAFCGFLAAEEANAFAF